MCVIYACIKSAPSQYMMDTAAEYNDDGAGIAWLGDREKDGKKTKVVFWEKGLGLKPKDIIAKLKDKPFPYLIHLRKASEGGVSEALCHPFPVSAHAETWAEGSAPSVLCQNGTWSAWKNEVRDAVYKSKAKFPGGEWNDTRALAWMVGNFGAGYLDIMVGSPGKIAILESNGNLFFGPPGDWKVHEDGNFFASNNQYHTKTTSGKTKNSGTTHSEVRHVTEAIPIRAKGSDLPKDDEKVLSGLLGAAAQGRIRLVA